MLKTIQAVHNAPRPHWVGDGFPVRSMFMYDNHGAQLSPFLMLDYAAPHRFEPADQPRGVGVHPHRGFETVTIVYEGELAHRDSTGAGGLIGPGDVQWMTAASGILHEEFHSPAFTQQGGTMQMAQLWVNLPARAKMSPPTYQNILNAQIPDVALPDGAGRARVIAGNCAGTPGAAHTHTPMDVWDLRLNADARTQLPLVNGHTAALVVLRGRVRINGDAVANESQLVTFGREGTAIELTTEDDAVVLFLGGEPINEPVAGYGPFVMNTREEIIQAFNDFQNGRFGQMTASA